MEWIFIAVTRINSGFPRYVYPPSTCGCLHVLLHFYGGVSHALEVTFVLLLMSLQTPTLINRFPLLTFQHPPPPALTVLSHMGFNITRL